MHCCFLKYPRGREGETVRSEREDEKNKNKKGIKNYEEIIFKWSCKKKKEVLMFGIL